SVRIGARLGGASADDLARLSRYGEHLGLAFQIADDLLDVNAGVAVAERAESSRTERRKATYPSVAGVVTARERLAELLQLSLRELDYFEVRGNRLQRSPATLWAGRFISRTNDQREEIHEEL